MSGDEQTMAAMQDDLLDNPALLDRLAELRGWSEPAIRRLGLGRMGDRVAFLIRDSTGQLCGLVRYQPNPERRDDGQPKSIATPGSPRELFPAVETLSREEVLWIVEG